MKPVNIIFTLAWPITLFILTINSFSAAQCPPDGLIKVASLCLPIQKQLPTLLGQMTLFTTTLSRQGRYTQADMSKLDSSASSLCESSDSLLKCLDLLQKCPNVLSLVGNLGGGSVELPPNLPELISDGVDLLTTMCTQGSLASYVGCLRKNNGANIKQQQCSAFPEFSFGELTASFSSFGSIMPGSSPSEASSRPLNCRRFTLFSGCMAAAIRRMCSADLANAMYKVSKVQGKTSEPECTLPDRASAAAAQYQRNKPKPTTRPPRTRPRPTRPPRTRPPRPRPTRPPRTRPTRPRPTEPPRTRPPRPRPTQPPRTRPPRPRPTQPPRTRPTRPPRTRPTRPRPTQPPRTRPTLPRPTQPPRTRPRPTRPPYTSPVTPAYSRPRQTNPPYSYTTTEVVSEACPADGLMKVMSACMPLQRRLPSLLSQMSDLARIQDKQGSFSAEDLRQLRQNSDQLCQSSEAVLDCLQILRKCPNVLDMIPGGGGLPSDLPQLITDGSRVLTIMCVNRALDNYIGCIESYGGVNLRQHYCNKYEGTSFGDFSSSFSAFANLLPGTETAEISSEGLNCQEFALFSGCMAESVTRACHSRDLAKAMYSVSKIQGETNDPPCDMPQTIADAERMYLANVRGADHTTSPSYYSTSTPYYTERLITSTVATTEYTEETQTKKITTTTMTTTTTTTTTANPVTALTTTPLCVTPVSYSGRTATLSDAVAIPIELYEWSDEDEVGHSSGTISASTHWLSLMFLVTSSLCLVLS